MLLLEVKNVSKGFGPKGKRTEVLEDITLEVEQGEFVAIIGYSGAGKTTLMSLFAGLIKPDSGSIKLNGKTMDGPGPDRGIVFQNYSLLPWLTRLRKHCACRGSGLPPVDSRATPRSTSKSRSRW